MGMPSKEVLWRLEDLFKKLMSKIKSETQKICDIIDNEVEIAKHDLEDVNYYRGARDIAERTKAFIKRGCRT
jgi:ElaB/YqjD/DUF883 family membrane-anchored ribosome-binding protein